MEDKLAPVSAETRLMLLDKAGDCQQAMATLQARYRVNLIIVSTVALFVIAGMIVYYENQLAQQRERKSGRSL